MLNKRDVRGTMQVVWTITLSTAKDVIVRAIVNMVNNQITVIPEMQGMGVTVDNVALQADGKVAFEVNGHGTWGECSARFVYDYVRGSIVSFIREGARDARGYNLPAATDFCHSRP